MTLLDTDPLTPLASRPESLTTMVYDAIRSAIITRALAPGSRVSESGLAQSLNVSKTPVREALLRLAHAGLVESDGRRGVLIPEPSIESLRAAYELRDALEGRSAELACTNAQPADIAAMQQAAKACLEGATQDDLEAFRQYDKEFHLAVAHGAHSRYLETRLADAYDLVWTLRLRDTPNTSLSVECAHDHQQILSAIKASDDDRAARLMRAHIQKVATAVLSSIDPANAAASHGPASP